MYISSRKDGNQSLWEQYVAGNKSVFGEIYAFYHKGLTAYCMSLLGNLDQAENVASDTLIKLLQQSNPGEIENYEGWLFSVAKNQCLTALSKSERRKKLLNENYQPTLEHLPDAEMQLSLENIDEIIQTTLDSKDYQIWQLHQQGYDNSEIAEILDSNEKTIANRKSAARTKLKEVFKKLNT